ncbi:uncharacterized protein PGTG_06616 [Puccinia graminis f. sp. tritici CRL 75-36-700-3]|uniref:Uncharacterized protein n=1 Tax=Puccinia graminis f. sp. tritici (strain CRL 75-36-700-3 / race SCCL) TaxID=418459 RepID=E3K8X8_PUCGT|nr:uncharacterized protein PGTG_06616 [Puccinia graminis f. sp. tritici CRL 75-36-700-3]EFP80660.1 hypothetical protein PGTG_06616 [Puccinia graminis f. sp. tritici CRL 75-36-700-3]
MQLFKVTMFLAAAACGLGAVTVDQAQKLIRCGGWHPSCYCTIKVVGVKDKWEVKEKCVYSGKGQHNFDPCRVYYNTDSSREAWCCEAGFQPELDMPSGHALSTSVMKHNCKRKNPQ